MNELVELEKLNQKSSLDGQKAQDKRQNLAEEGTENHHYFERDFKNLVEKLIRFPVNFPPQHEELIQT